MTMSCHGLGVRSSRSVAVGRAFVIARCPCPATPGIIAAEAIDAELARLDAALEGARAALQAVREQIPATTPLSIAEFIDTHLLMLQDAALVDEARELIRQEACSAEWALQRQRDALIRVFDAMDDPYLRNRRHDVDHVVLQIQAHLHGDPRPDSLEAQDLVGRVIIAEDLAPADAILLGQRGAVAFVTECGGPMSHTAILARSLNIPAVVGVHHATRYFRHGETVVVDGATGAVLADLDAATLAFYDGRIRALEERRLALQGTVDRPSVTLDGVVVGLYANLELPDDARVARANGAAGVGLYRTEFLYMNRSDLPDEDEHLAAYVAVIDGLAGIPVTIRTLDLGVDKQVDALGAHCPPACNPALGLRAIRLCLQEPDLFRPQLRAILRASARGPVRLMLPMITSVEELDGVLAVIAQVQRELRADGLAFDRALPIGGMVEVPSAALCAEALARRLDFLSIGTNDLTQYTLAVDRMDDAVSYLYDPVHPAVLRLIAMTIEAGQATGTPVAMCGELAGDPRYTRLLLGMGLREFSMQPGALLDVKAVVRRTDISALAPRVAALLEPPYAGDPARLVEEINRDGDEDLAAGLS
jgi:phosphoenolpyruvate-protein phosphotransferase (PTS system enzyme I)